MDYKQNYAIVLAGGRGSRMGSDIPKQYINVNGYPVLYWLRFRMTLNTASMK